MGEEVTNHADTLHVTFLPLLRCYIVAVRDAINLFQSTLVKGKILDYVSLKK